MKKMKPTLGPMECNHCHRIWYGTRSKGTWVPHETILCRDCWHELDEYLYHQFPGIYTLSQESIKPEHISALHVEAKTWVADSGRMPHRPKNLFRDGGVPRWMQSALKKGLVRTNSSDVYVVTVDEAGEALSVETSQDRTLLRKPKK